MLGRILLLCVLLGAVAHPILARPGDVGLRGAVHRDEPVEHAPHPLRQRLVGEIHVGEQCVAAERRHFAGDQHGGHRRLIEIGRVGVPQPAEIRLLALQLDNRRDLRKSLDALDEGIFDHLAETSGKLQEKLRRERLVAEEHDEMLEPGAPDRVDRLVARIMREIDVHNLGPQGARHGADLDAVVPHAAVPFPQAGAASSAQRRRAAISIEFDARNPNHARHGAGGQPMRIAVGGFMHETNTFVAVPTIWDDFVRAGPWPTVTQGEAIRSVFRGLNLGIAHFMEKAQAAGHAIVPLAWAGAQPGGRVTDDAFERMAGKLIPALEREQPDAVYLELHGAMVTESHDDGEAELLRRVRSAIGPAAPILVSLDLHANVSPQMGELAAHRPLPAAEAVAKAIRISASASRPVVLSDTQDNPGAGAPSNTTGLIAELLRQGAERTAVGILHDPAAAAAAHRSGTGGTLATLGGGGIGPGQAPLPGPWRVAALSDGRFRGTAPMLPRAPSWRSRARRIFAPVFRKSPRP